MEQNSSPRPPAQPMGAIMAKELGEKNIVRTIHSMKDDVEEAVTKQKETAASIALAEVRKQEREREAALAAARAAEEARLLALAAKPKSHAGMTILIIFLILLIIGGGAGYLYLSSRQTTITVPLLGDLHFGQKKQAAPVVPVTPPKPFLAPALIQPQSEKRFALAVENPEHISAAIAVERTAGLTQGTVKNFYFTEQVPPEGAASLVASVGTNRLLSFMGINAPQSMIRFIDPQFMIGLLGETGSVAVPFIIIKTTDYGAGRIGMLQWESSLPGDFDKIFGTKLASTPRQSDKFKDIIVAGKDARMMDTNSDTGLVYAIVDAQTIVIAGSRTSISEIVPLTLGNK